jgi:hypothetical protein
LVFGTQSLSKFRVEDGLLPGGPGLNLRHSQLRFGPVPAPAFRAGEFSLRPPQVPLRGPVMARVCDAFPGPVAVGDGREIFEAEDNTGDPVRRNSLVRYASGVRHVHNEGHTEFARRFEDQRDAGRLGGKLPRPRDFDFPDLRQPHSTAVLNDTNVSLSPQC